ncbi:MAG: hypothetical protein WHV67_05125 [Thermoanaerobaculia bacterium]
MNCRVLQDALREGKFFEELENHILNCPDCENFLEEYVNFKYLKIEDLSHPHLDFLEKFSQEPFEKNFIKEAINCPLCFKILNTYQKTFRFLKKIPSKRGLKKVLKAPFREEGFFERISSIALSLILFFVITLATITRGNLSLTFAKFQTFYAETRGKTISFYGKLLGYGANKLKEDKNEMHQSQ